MMKVVELARTGQVYISPKQSVRSALTLMTQGQLPGLVVKDNERIQGVACLSELASRHPNRLILDTTIKKVSLLPYDIDITLAWQTMREERIGVHPLVDSAGNPCGLLAQEDVMEYMAHENSDTTATAPRTKKILVVDNNDKDRELIKKILQETGYQIYTAASSRAVIDKIKQGEPDLILFRASLQNKSNYEALKYIKTSPVLNNKLVIMMSPASDTASTVQTLKFSTGKYLLKPFSKVELLAKIAPFLKSDELFSKIGERRGEGGAHLVSKYIFSEQSIENIGEGIIIMDLAGTILKINKTALDILKIAPETNVEGIAISSINPLLATFYKMGSSSGCLIKLSIPDATRPLAIEYTSNYLEGQPGKSKNILTLFRDLTPTKEAMVKLQKNEETLQALMDTTTERMILTDISGKILATNAFFSKSIGQSVNDLIGKCIWDYLPTEVANSRKYYVDELKKTKSQVYFKDARNGKILDTSLYPIIDADGEVEKVAVFSRDITEQILSRWQLEKEQEETLLLKNMLKSVMDNMMTGLVVTAPSGDILLINKSAQKILGTTEKDCIKKPIQFLSEDLQAFTKVLPYETFGREISVRLADGSIKPLGFTSSHLGDSSQYKTGVITVFKDLTEIYTIQKELKEKERLATVGEIARHIAHEIKNPIFSISASLQTLERNLKRSGDNGPEEEKDNHLKLLGILYQETQRINRLLNTLSLMGKNQTVLSEEFFLDELIDFIILENSAAISQKKLRVTRYFSSQRPIVKADRDKVLQVLNNIILNAISFSPEKGALTISFYYCRKSTTVRFNIGDEGPGIPQENLEKIFTPFFTTRQDGTGLGLTISKKIIEMHGGTIIARNKMAGGAVFSITMPV